MRLENVAVAVTRVVDRPPAAVIRGVKSVDVYTTIAKLVIFAFLDTRVLGKPSLALQSARTHRASSVWVFNI